jgi:hypothetical protein
MWGPRPVKDAIRNFMKGLKRMTPTGRVWLTQKFWKRRKDVNPATVREPSTLRQKERDSSYPLKKEIQRTVRIAV